MKISFRTFDGKEYVLDNVEPNDLILDVKDKLEEKAAIDADTHRLVLNENNLDNNKKVSECGIAEGSIVYLIARAKTEENQGIEARNNCKNGKTVAGVRGRGETLRALNSPYGIFVDSNQRLLITDWGNHRIVECDANTDLPNKGRVVIRGRGQGNTSYQLNSPTDVVVDRDDNNSLIIADHGNRRVVRWSRSENATEGEVIIKDIACWGLALDKNRRLYVTDTEKHQVVRFDLKKNPVVRDNMVLGGPGRGSTLKKFNQPTYVSVDSADTVYVADPMNHRVVRWVKDATQGTLLGHCFPRGISTDEQNNVYVADFGNHCVKKWTNGSGEPKVIVGGPDEDEKVKEYYFPFGVFVNQQGVVYTSDIGNHRVERFLTN